MIYDVDVIAMYCKFFLVDAMNFLGVNNNYFLIDKLTTEASNIATPRFNCYVQYVSKIKMAFLCRFS